ncbi:site-specific recombination directionality factor RDF [Microbacterium phage phiMiGM15]
MKTRTRTAAAVAALALLGGGLAACSTDADTASRNIATAAELFEVQRTIVGINGITGETTFFAEGRCSFESSGRRFDVTCRYGPDEYRKHVFIMGDQDSVSITQEEAIDVSLYHTRVILKPQSVIPEFDLEVGKQ